MSGIEIAFDGPVARLAMDFRGKLNLLDVPAIGALREAAGSLQGRRGLRVAVLSGAAGKAFAGGADLRAMRGLAPGTARAFIAGLAEAFRAVREIEVPVVAVIEGYALGAGLELAMACDVRVAAADAKLGMPEVRVGVPSVIEAAFLPRLVGWGRAQDLLYTGKMIEAGEAQRIGLVSRVAPADEIQRAGRAAADEIATCGPTAIRAQKRLLRRWHESHLEASIAAGIEEFDRTFEAGDPREGMNAFLERRQARFED
jgi:enoyl-CoA hydratase/carnithine racemase